MVGVSYVGLRRGSLKQCKRATYGRGKDWIKHIREEHNVWSYVYFMLSIQDKPLQECTALEKFTKMQIEQSKTECFPSG